MRSCHAAHTVVCVEECNRLGSVFFLVCGCDGSRWFWGVATCVLDFFVMAPRKPRDSSPPISPVADVVGGWLGGTRAEQYRPPGRDAFRPRETVEFETTRPDGSGNQTEFQYRTIRREL